MLLRHGNEFWKIVRYSIVGAVVTVVHIGVAMLAVSVLGFNPTVAAALGFCCSFFVAYTGHLRFTFAVAGRYSHYMLKFAVSSIASFCLSTGTVWLATSILQIDYRPALIALVVIVPICNYFINRFWVFLQPANMSDRSLETI